MMRAGQTATGMAMKTQDVFAIQVNQVTTADAALMNRVWVITVDVVHMDDQVMIMAAVMVLLMAGPEWVADVAHMDSQVMTMAVDAVLLMAAQEWVGDVARMDNQVMTMAADVILPMDSQV